MLKIRKNNAGDREVFDPVRKKWVAYTPEEHVRQLFLSFLTVQKKYSAAHIAVEYPFVFENGKKQRADIVVFNRNAQPLMIVECKAAHIKITDETFRQIARYNARIRAPYIVVSNSVNNYCLRTRDFVRYDRLTEFPDYETLCSLFQNSKASEAK